MAAAGALLADEPLCVELLFEVVDGVVVDALVLLAEELALVLASLPQAVSANAQAPAISAGNARLVIRVQNGISSAPA